MSSLPCSSCKLLFFVLGRRVLYVSNSSRMNTGAVVCLQIHSRNRRHTRVDLPAPEQPINAVSLPDRHRPEMFCRICSRRPSLAVTSKQILAKCSSQGCSKRARDGDSEADSSVQDVSPHSARSARLIEARVTRLGDFSLNSFDLDAAPSTARQPVSVSAGHRDVRALRAVLDAVRSLRICAANSTLSAQQA